MEQSYLESKLKEYEIEYSLEKKDRNTFVVINGYSLSYSCIKKNYKASFYANHDRIKKACPKGMPNYGDLKQSEIDEIDASRVPDINFLTRKNCVLKAIEANIAHCKVYEDVYIKCYNRIQEAIKELETLLQRYSDAGFEVREYGYGVGVYYVGSPTIRFRIDRFGKQDVRVNFSYSDDDDLIKYFKPIGVKNAKT